MPQFTQQQLEAIYAVALQLSRKEQEIDDNIDILAETSERSALYQPLRERRVQLMSYLKDICQGIDENAIYKVMSRIANTLQSIKPDNLVRRGQFVMLKPEQDATKAMLILADTFSQLKMSEVGYKRKILCAIAYEDSLSEQGLFGTVLLQFVTDYLQHNPIPESERLDPVSLQKLQIDNKNLEEMYRAISRLDFRVLQQLFSAGYQPDRAVVLEKLKFLATALVKRYNIHRDHLDIVIVLLHAVSKEDLQQIISKQSDAMKMIIDYLGEQNKLDFVLKMKLLVAGLQSVQLTISKQDIEKYNTEVLETATLEDMQTVLELSKKVSSTGDLKEQLIPQIEFMNETLRAAGGDAVDTAYTATETWLREQGAVNFKAVFKPT